MVIFDAATTGTRSALWESDYRYSLAQEQSLDELRELVVIAAHPDDETLGAGGLIAHAADRRVPIHVIVVTDGAGSHPRSPSVSPGQLRLRRVEELRAALAHLAPEARITLLGIPDGQTREHSAQISRRLRVELDGSDPAAHVAVVWSGDGHADHDTVGRIVEDVVSPAVTLLSYPVWLWHWGHPDHEAVPWDRVRALPLPESVLERKQRAISAFLSQTEPLSPASGDERVLHPEMLEHFRRDREMYLVRSPRDVS